MCMLPVATAAEQPSTCSAHALLPAQRQQLALDALAGQPVSQLADIHHVSRKFVYQQLHHAHDALQEASDPDDDPPDQLLFWMPVTKPWLRPFVLGLVLVCPSSLRGVTELLDDLFDYPLALGSVPNIVQQAVVTARRLNQQQDLSRIRGGAHDEIFQAGRPVLVGAEVASTYCYLKSPEEHRHADTWGVRRLELVDRGFQPQATIADFAGGLRAAPADVLPGVPCRGDVCRVCNEAVPLVTYLENRA